MLILDTSPGMLHLFCLQCSQNLFIRSSDMHPLIQLSYVVHLLVLYMGFLSYWFSLGYQFASHTMHVSVFLRTLTHFSSSSVFQSSNVPCTRILWSRVEWVLVQFYLFFLFVFMEWLLVWSAGIPSSNVFCTMYGARV